PLRNFNQARTSRSPIPGIRRVSHRLLPQTRWGLGWFLEVLPRLRVMIRQRSWPQGLAQTNPVGPVALNNLSDPHLVLLGWRLSRRTSSWHEASLERNKIVDPGRCLAELFIEVREEIVERLGK